MVTIGIVVVVLSMFLCGSGYGMWKFTRKYEFVKGKLKIKESYERQKALKSKYNDENIKELNA